MNNLQEKRLAIAESIINTATQIVQAASDYPKRNKYFFKRKKIRGRSRQEKQKRKRLLFQIAFAKYTGAAQVAQIIQTPIPKFQSGGRSAGKTYETMAWVGVNGAEIISK